jgi:hypothetical protein
MNEQIRQLLLEAQALAREQVKNTPEFAKYAPSYAIPGTEIHVGLGLSYEKFAELIVQKCVSIVAERKDQAIDEAWNIDEAMSASMFAIEDYFGVER